MSRLNTLLALTLIGLATTTHAGSGNRGHQGGGSYQDWARVTHVEPHYERVRAPGRQCSSDPYYDHETPQYYNTDRSVGGAVIGGIAGGLIGSQIGKDSGRTAATAVGAAVGAIVGDRIDNDGHPGSYPVARSHPGPRCYDVDRWDNRVTGYRVTYEYNGRRYTRFMTHDPGRRVRVIVSVAPA